MGRASQKKKEGGTRDHTVPQMYLRHFAEHQARRQYLLSMRRIDNPSRVIPAAPSKISVETGFYWGTTLDNIPHHACEEFFSQLEGSADPVLKTILDDKEWALTPNWPLTPEQRGALAWWMAAQVLRTTRQRKRLTHVLPPTEKNHELPEHIGKLAANNPHLHYIVDNIAALAATLYDRPWGLGFSDMCLLTSDVPVAVWNRPDEDDQILAVAQSDVMLPLDPHRLLFLPSPTQQRTDLRKRVDHLLHIKGAVGMALVGIAWDVAEQFVVHHPQHDPWKHWKPAGPRQPRPWAGESHPAPQYALEYPVFPQDRNIERRWTIEHPPPRAAAVD
ncbi:DUF4238 domain-containing protein [Streptomyces sp. NPDC127105]|uniref:DUF4238 domain-containing protein n=1 Tax=Streptomyces sp. NPDC127105 TaxID=3345359 RepID=UPI0036671DE1